LIAFRFVGNFGIRRYSSLPPNPSYACFKRKICSAHRLIPEDWIPAMFAQDGLAIPELLDLILDSLEDDDIYHCLFVSRQFNDHAYPFLFRNITLCLSYDTGLQRPKGTSYNYQKNLRERLLKSSLLSKSSRVTVILNDNNNKLKPTLEDTFDHIMQKANNLKLVTINDRRTLWRYPSFTMSRILKAFCKSAAKSKLSLSFTNPEMEAMDYLDCLSEGRDRLISLSTSETGPPKSLLKLLHECPSLRKIKMMRSMTSHYLLFPSLETTELTDVFQSIPLEYLALASTSFQFLPETLRFLQIDVGYNGWRRQVLSEEAWKAICELENLETLRLACEFADWTSGYSPQFKSTKLKCLKASIADNTSGLSHEGTAFERIINPILEECQQLKEIMLQSMLAPRDFITRVFKSAKDSVFVYLNPSMTVYNGGNFQEIITGVANSPYLTDLTLPWPQGPNKLSLREANTLATSCDDLEVIAFRTNENYPPCLPDCQHVETLDISRYEDDDT
jgi:hypothetical protein